MAFINSSLQTQSRFFAPALDLLPACTAARLCPSLSDADWLRLGVARCLQPQRSGRGFLQTIASLASDLCPDHSHFFETLKSDRRLALCTELNAKLCDEASLLLPDALSLFPSLAGFDIHAADGHFHAHATHDQPATDGKKYAVGHFYSRNLRTGMLSHLTVADQVKRKKEHDMRALKRMGLATLKQRAKKGRKVLYVYDKAGIDFRQWYEWKQGSGIYMLSRCKENMVFTQCGHLPFDRSDPINTGVVSDELVGHGSSSVAIRRIVFHDVVSGTTYEFITNVTEGKVPPGVLAYLYKMRWNIEKSFDEIKNKLGEQKAWASSATAKTMQAQFLCMTLNLLQLFEHKIQTEEDIHNEPENKRRAARLEKVKEAVKKAGGVFPKILDRLIVSTQHSVKFIRWVATELWIANPWSSACTTLEWHYRAL
jgi:hypothetical protein